MATTTAERLPGHPEATAMRWPPRLALGATALTVALVLFRLGDKSLWYDEAYSVGTVDRPLGDVFWRIANWEVNQSPFFVLLSGWWRLGQSEAFLRLLPGAFAVAAVPAMYVLGRRMLGAPAGAVSALLVACHPLALQWGQQLRGYSLVLLLTILAAVQVLRALDDPDSRWDAIGAGAAAALATYGHFFAGLVWAAFACWLVLHRPLPVRLLRTSGLTYVLLVAPLALFLVTRQGDPLYWLGERDSGSAFANSARELSGGTWWAVGAYGLAVAAGGWATARSPREGTGAPSHLALAALWLLGPVAVVTASTLTVKPLLEGRFLVVVLPAFVLLAVAGVARVGPTAGPVLLALLVATSVLGLERWYTASPVHDWREATRVIGESVLPDADIVVEPSRAVFALRYYEDRLDLEAHDVLRPGLFDPPAGDDLVEVRMRSTGRPAPLPPPYLAWRDQHYAPRADYSVQGVEIRVFERRSTR